jgi:hypothetical protein
MPRGFFFSGVKKSANLAGMASPPSQAPVRTLAAAKEEIRRLKALLAAPVLPGGKPIPKSPGPPPSVPNPALPGSPQADLGGMAPAAFSDFLSHCDDKTLLNLLSCENGKSRKLKNNGVVTKLHREIKKRRKS